MCDGIDNDGDGLVDEDFGDVDADGVADCVDASCIVAIPDPVTERDPTCGVGNQGTPPADPTDWVVEWHWNGYDVQATPIVGDIDADGVPEVFVPAKGSVYQLDGATGVRERKFGQNVATEGAVALGDVDSDGRPELIATTETLFKKGVVAFEADGTALWAVSVATPYHNTNPSVHDLDGDGDVEVLAFNHVLDGQTGAVITRFPLPLNSYDMTPVAADLDLDGRMEILLENEVFDLDGTPLWRCGIEAATDTNYPHPVNVDADPEGEVLLASDGKLTLCDDDGTVLWTENYTGTSASSMTVADFDGDGLQEFVLAHKNRVDLLDADRNVRWSVTTEDAVGALGVTSWDIDLDGVPEVLHADEDDFRVIHGATGTVLIHSEDHFSLRRDATPSVADVDGDGQGELLFASSSYHDTMGVWVIGGADGDWPPSPPVYNQHTYSGANVNVDLTIPAAADPPWLAPGRVFRGQPSAFDWTPTPDLAAAISDVCVASCDPGGAASVAVQVWNRGNVDVDAGVVLRLYGISGAAETLILEHVLTDRLPIEGSFTLTVATTIDAIGDTLEVRVDEDDAVFECVEDDVGTWVVDACP